MVTLTVSPNGLTIVVRDPECGQNPSQEDQRQVRVLSEFFGILLLSQITRAHVEEFKQSRKGRLLSPEKPVSVATCNRELACLRHILRLAVEEGLRESAPLVKL